MDCDTFWIKECTTKFFKGWTKFSKNFMNLHCLYIYDILISSDNEVDHINHLASLQRNARNVKCYFIKKKAKIMKPRIDFLGLIIDETEIEIQPHIYEKKIFISR